MSAATRNAIAAHLDSMEAPPGKFPLLLAPGELQVVDVTIPADTLAQLFDVATELPAKDNFFEIKGLRVLYGTLQYATIKLSGAVKGATSEREFEVHPAFRTAASRREGRMAKPVCPSAWKDRRAQARSTSRQSSLSASGISMAPCWRTTRADAAST